MYDFQPRSHNDVKSSESFNRLESVSAMQIVQLTLASNTESTPQILSTIIYPKKKKYLYKVAVVHFAKTPGIIHKLIKIYFIFFFINEFSLLEKIYICVLKKSNRFHSYQLILRIDTEGGRRVRLAFWLPYARVEDIRIEKKASGFYSQ